MPYAEKKLLHRIPLYVAITAFFIVVLSLGYTKVWEDASVQLNRRTLCCLMISLHLCLAGIFIRKKKTAEIISISGLALTLGCIGILIYHRNPLDKIYVKDAMIDSETENKIEHIMGRSGTVILANVTKTNIPERMQQYLHTNVLENEKIAKRFHIKRINSENGTVFIEEAKLKDGRFSGLAEKMIVLLEKNLVNDENYSELGFVLL